MDNMIQTIDENFVKANIKPTKYTHYETKSAYRQIYISEFNAYIGNPFVQGNSKLHTNIAVFDLLADYTCVNNEKCKTSCYALKAQRIYPAVWNKRLFYTYLAFNKLDYLKQILQTALEKLKVPYVRIHSSGDFISLDYINMWYSLIQTSSKIFYFYTKVDNTNIDALSKLSNVNKVSSILPDGSLNYGSHDYVANKAIEFNIPICPYTTTNKIKCGTTCTLCIRKTPYILFYQH